MEILAPMANKAATFVKKAFDEDNTEVLPKVAFAATMLTAAVLIFKWLPDHDMANGRRG